MTALPLLTTFRRFLNRHSPCVWEHSECSATTKFVQPLSHWLIAKYRTIDARFPHLEGGVEG